MESGAHTREVIATGAIRQGERTLIPIVVRETRRFRKARIVSTDPVGIYVTEGDTEYYIPLIEDRQIPGGEEAIRAARRKAETAAPAGSPSASPGI